MKTFVLFDCVWHAEIIERFSPDTGNPSLDGLSRAILASSCILAQSVDSLTKAVNRAIETQDGLHRIAEAIDKSKKKPAER